MRLLRCRCVLAIFVVCLTFPLLAQTNPVPLINQPLVPTSAAPGGPGFTLTVNGTGFSSSSVVRWNGATLVTTVVSNQKLTAQVPASKISKAGTATVTVMTPGVPSSNTIFFPIATAETAVGFSQLPVPNANIAYYSVAVDINHDGKLDLVLNGESGTQVLLGNGDGKFTSVFSSAACGSGPPVLADFNRDGNLDIAASNDNVVICLGKGDGTFAAFSTVSVNGYADVVIAGDFNYDGKLDLAMTVNSGPNSLAIALGNGDGTFQEAQGSGAASGFYLALAAGDFNGDRVLDVAEANLDDGYILIALGNGDGTFGAPFTYPLKGNPSGLLAADFTGDKKLDLAVVNSGVVSILLGNGDGTFQGQADYTASPGAAEVVVGDINNHGKPDLVVSDYSDNLISVLLGNGKGTFQIPTQFPTTNLPYSLNLGDFDGDGRLDVLTLTCPLLSFT